MRDERRTREAARTGLVELTPKATTGRVLAPLTPAFRIKRYASLTRRALRSVRIQVDPRLYFRGEPQHGGSLVAGGGPGSGGEGGDARRSTSGGRATSHV